MVVDDRLGVDTEAVVDRCEEFLRMYGVLQRSTGGLVRLTMHVTAFDARTGNDARVTVWPVVTAVITVSVTAGADAALWAASEFTDHDNQCFIQQTTLIKVRNQTADGTVQHRSRLVLHAVGQTNVVVP